MPDTFTTKDERGREVDHERLTDDEEMEAHIAAVEQHSGDANLTRALRYLGGEIVKLRGGNKQDAAAMAGDPGAQRQRDAEARRVQLQRELDDLNRDNPARRDAGGPGYGVSGPTHTGGTRIEYGRDNPATTPDAAPVNASTQPPAPGQQPEMRSFQTPSGNAALETRSDA